MGRRVNNPRGRHLKENDRQWLLSGAGFELSRETENSGKLVFGPALPSTEKTFLMRWVVTFTVSKIGDALDTV